MTVTKVYVDHNPQSSYSFLYSLDLIRQLSLNFSVNRERELGRKREVEERERERWKRERGGRERESWKRERERAGRERERAGRERERESWKRERERGPIKTIRQREKCWQII